MQYRMVGDVLAKQMADELVLMNLQTSKIFVANETGSLIWRAIEQGQNLDEVTSGLIEAAPDKVAARDEIKAFVDGLRLEGFIAESE